MTGYTPTPDYYNDYIAHFGILGMKWGRRKKKKKSSKTKIPQILKYKPKKQMTDFESAMYNDPRYKRHDDALKDDPRFKRWTSAMKGDPRYSRQGSAMKNDPRYQKPVGKRKRWK